jgi:hypothetical protein
MPRGRLLSQSISYSESIEWMSEWAQLLFDRIVIHVDDFGRIEAAPAVLKAKTKPLSKRKLADFATAVAEMVSVGVVIAYIADDRVLLQVAKHDEHQRIDRRTESRYPAVSGAPLSAVQVVSALGCGKAPDSPALSPRREEKRREEEDKSNKPRAGANAGSFSPGDSVKRWTAEKFPMLDFEEEVGAFVDHHTAKGSSFKDWDAALRTWIRNSAKWSRGNGRSPSSSGAKGTADRADARTAAPDSGRSAQSGSGRKRFEHRSAADVLANRGVHPVSSGTTGGPDDPVR